jgi:hypothetical protein
MNLPPPTRTEEERLPPVLKKVDPMNTSGLLNESEAAESLSMQAQTLSKWRQRDFGPAFLKQGGRVLYRPEDLKLWQDSCRIVPSEKSPRKMKPRRKHRKKQPE